LAGFLMQLAGSSEWPEGQGAGSGRCVRSFVLRTASGEKLRLSDDEETFQDGGAQFRHLNFTAARAPQRTILAPSFLREEVSCSDLLRVVATLG
jgi:hypothetical protein